MRVLEILPTYPGEPFDGSAVYERSLNRALTARGVHVEVLTTRTRRLRPLHAFGIGWPDELPERGEHDGVSIRRFHALDTSRFGKTISNSILRRWSREDFAEGAIVAGSARFPELAVSQAKTRPARFDVMADIGRGPLTPRLLFELTRIASRFDVILAGYAPFSLPRQAIWAAGRSGTPVVLLPFIHESDRYHQFTSIVRTYDRAAAVLTLSAHTSAFLRANVPGANPVTLGAGVTAPPGSGCSADEFRARHDLGDGPVVLYVGRKEAGKRYQLAVDAIGLLEGAATLVMVGRDVDGVSIDSDSVRHLGLLPDDELAAAYEACDVFVLPSAFESFGMVFLDAWSRAKPVIGNRACGASACLIDDGVDGFLSGDAQEIARAVRRLLDDPDMAARMGAAGRAKVEAEYTWERVADRALIAFEEVSRNGGGRAPSAHAGSSRRPHTEEARL